MFRNESGEAGEGTLGIEFRFIGVNVGVSTTYVLNSAFIEGFTVVLRGR